MAGRSVSPGAALLRASRMFSMPAPLPPPAGEYTSATRYHSESATEQYPRHLAVTTPSNSRAHGDWGFKRPLPLKTTTKTTYPLAKINQVDSIESVTDFRQGGDHTISLQKWHEMNMPLTIPRSDDPSSTQLQQTNISVFEDEYDITAITAENNRATARQRWKFTGPWLAGMTNGQFDRYIDSIVRGRRTEFREFIKERLAAEMTAKQSENAQVADSAALEPVKPESITDRDLLEYFRSLRQQDRTTLYRLVSEFLDLPPLDTLSDVKLILGDMSPRERATVVNRDNPYATMGPPSSHPSAGLSYLRTDKFQANHPLYGPQRHHSPVEARVLVPRQGLGGKTRIGAGGFVVTTPPSSFLKSSGDETFASVDRFDPSIEGGAKVYVRPNAAHIDAKGKAVLKVLTPDPGAVLVQKEMVGKYPLYSEAASKRAQLAAIPRRSWVRAPKSKMGDSSSYGLF